MLHRLAPLAALPLLGCATRLPPPPTPEKIMPRAAMSAPPPREGEGTVLIDATNGPARVGVAPSHISVAAVEAGAETTVVCAATPCAVNLPYGVYTVLLENKNDPAIVGVDALQVGEVPSVFRHTMGFVHSEPGLRRAGATLAGLGGSAALVGALLIPLGSISYDDKAPLNGMRTAGIVTLGVGGGLAITGLVMYLVGLPRKQPGASIQWTPEGATPAPTRAPSPPKPSGPLPTEVKQVRLGPAGLELAFE